MKKLMKLALILVVIYLVIGLIGVLRGKPLQNIVTWGYCGVTGFIQGYTGQSYNPPAICK